MINPGTGRGIGIWYWSSKINQDFGLYSLFNMVNNSLRSKTGTNSCPAVPAQLAIKITATLTPRTGELFLANSWMFGWLVGWADGMDG